MVHVAASSSARMQARSAFLACSTGWPCIEPERSITKMNSRGAGVIDASKRGGSSVISAVSRSPSRLLHSAVRARSAATL